MSEKSKEVGKFPKKNEKETAKEPKNPDEPEYEEEKERKEKKEHGSKCKCKSCEKRRTMAKKMQGGAVTE